MTRVLQEAACLRVLGERFPGIVPPVVFVDPEANALAMECAPDSARTWKEDLMKGRIDPTVVDAVGRMLGQIHAGTLGDAGLRDSFFATRAFYQLRIDPYLLTLIDRHPDLGRPLAERIAQMGVHRCALVHGDFSPKNVLVDVNPGGDGIWVLDCEPVHYGDPAFDLAFALNHLLLKGFYRPWQGCEYAAAATAFLAAYRQGAQAASELTAEAYDRRTALLLGALLLARVDGKSPAEYLTESDRQSSVRRLGRAILADGTKQLNTIFAEAIGLYAALREEER